MSCLNQDAGPSAPAAEEVPVPDFAEADPNGCDPTDADPNGCDLDDADPNGCNPAKADTNGCTVHIIDEDEEEEDEIPLLRKNSRRYIASGESSGVLLQLCLPSLVCKNCLWQTLIRLLKTWSQKICCQSRRMVE